MTPNDRIYHRKPCRNFPGKPVDGEMIEKIKRLVDMRYELTKK